MNIKHTLLSVTKSNTLKFLLIGLITIITFQSEAQEKKVIQLSGLVVSGDSLYGVPGAYIYAPKTGRGTTSTYVGYFSLPAISGDTLLIKAIGYKLKKYVVPEVEEKASIMLELTMDTTFLPAVEIFPWSTEKDFKQAFLALDLSNSPYNNAQRNFNGNTLNRMLYGMPDDGSLNHRYFMNYDIQSRTSGIPTFNIIDPFAWKKFFKSVKNGDLRQREE